MPPRKSGKGNGAPKMRRAQPQRQLGAPGQTVSAPVASSTSQRQSGLMLNGRRSGRNVCTVVKNRELIGNVNGSIAFAATKYPINPGIPSTFPVLSQTAQQWEEYRFRKLRFEFVTRAASSAVGSVILAPDYDAQDVTPTSESRATSYDGAIEGSVWVNHICALDPSSMHELGPRKFIRSTAVAGDIKTYDAGNFFICTTDEVDTSMIGKLWVDYEVELYNQQLEPTAAPVPTRASFYGSAVNQNFVSGIAELVDFTLLADALGWGAQTAGYFTNVPSGVYKIEFEATMLSTAAQAAGLTCVVEFLVGGLAMNPVRERRTNEVTGASTRSTISLTSYAVFSGTQSFGVNCTITGIAGAVSLIQDNTRLAITLV